MSTVKDGREIVFNRVRVIKRSFKLDGGLVSIFATSWNLPSSFGDGFSW